MLKQKLITATEDPAVLALEKLDDSIRASFDVLETDVKAIREEGERTKVRLGDIESTIERRTEGREVVGAIKKDNPPDRHIDVQTWQEERWLRGYLLQGSGDESRRSLGKAIMEATYPHRYEQYLDSLRVEKAAAISSSADTVTVPVFSEVIANRAEERSVRRASRVVQLRSDSTKVPKINAAFTAGLVAEGGTIADGGGTYTSATLNTIKFASRAIVNLEHLEDAAFPIAEDVFTRIMNAVIDLENNQALEGDGAGNNFTGVLNAAGVNTVALGATPTNMDKLMEMVTTIAASMIDPAECRWFMSVKAARKLLQIKEGTTNAPMIQQSGILAELVGYPVTLTDQISNTRGAGAETTVYWGNFRVGAMFGDRGPDRFDTSFDPSWSTAGVDLRFIRRTSVLVVLPALFVKGTGMTV